MFQRTSLLIAILTLIALDSEAQTERSVSDVEAQSKGSFTLEARTAQSYGNSAYSFRHKTQQLNRHKNYVDLVFQNDQLHVNMHGGQENAIADAGRTPLDEIKRVPKSELSPRPVVPTKGNSYVQRISFEKQTCFVKFKVIDLQPDQVEIEWKMLDENDRMPVYNIQNRGAAGTMGFRPSKVIKRNKNKYDSAKKGKDVRG